MKATKIRFQQRGVGDCTMAKGHETYGLFFESNVELQKLVKDIYNEFKHEFFIKPKVSMTGRTTTRTMGYANPRTGAIKMNSKGANVAVLIHELAHLWKPCKLGPPHGHWFKNSQTQMLMWWEKNRDNYVDRNVKIETKTEESLADLIGRVTTSRPTRPLHNPDNITTGDRVWWLRKNGERVEGTVTRVNTKSVTVKDCYRDGVSMGQGYFRVSPSMLKRVGEKVKIVDETPKPKIKPMPKPEPKKVTPEPINDTDEELYDLIAGLMDGLSKYAIHDSLSMSAISRCLYFNGVCGDDNRRIAINYVKGELGLKIR